jgi:hypothetical protein
MQQNSGAGDNPPPKRSLVGEGLRIAANPLECARADLELRDGGVGVVGAPAAHCRACN